MLFQILNLAALTRVWTLHTSLAFCFLFWTTFFSLIRRFMENESGLPGGEMEFRDVTGLFLKAADGKYLSQGFTYDHSFR